MQLDKIRDVLDSYQGHSLEDLEKAELMNRVDSKFLVPKAVLPLILEELQGDFTSLQIKDKRLFNYESVYFDTQDYRFYFLHHGGKLNRHKVRVRRYVDSGIQFLEVKFKNNKKRTIKNRIKTEFSRLNNLEPYRDFLEEVGVSEVELLEPVLRNQYQRMQLASEARGERLTIDLNLSNESLNFREGQVQLSDLSIVELKQEKVDRRSPFYVLARKYNLRPSSFSKYCMGMTFTQGGKNLKYNRFKPILRRLDQITKQEVGELEVC